MTDISKTTTSAPPETPAQVIEFIAKVAASVGFHANIGASETAGMIVSVLAANPHIQEQFWRDGFNAFIDGPIELRAENGALTFLAQTGEILTPAELVRRTQGDGAIQ